MVNINTIHHLNNHKMHSLYSMPSVDHVHFGFCLSVLGYFAIFMDKKREHFKINPCYQPSNVHVQAKKCMLDALAEA